MVCSTLWSIWLARNEKIFQNVRIKRKDLNHVIILRSFKWVVANGWLEESHVKEWYNNPQGIISTFSHKLCLEFWKEKIQENEFVAAMDGSWYPSTGKGGIGGTIKDREKKLLFLFLWTDNGGK